MQGVQIFRDIDVHAKNSACVSSTGVLDMLFFPAAATSEIQSSC
jgi:hypothetical protein